MPTIGTDTFEVDPPLVPLETSIVAVSPVFTVCRLVSVEEEKATLCPMTASGATLSWYSDPW